MQDYVTLAIVAAALIVASVVIVKRLRGKRSKGGCGECSGCDSGPKCGC